MQLFVYMAEVSADGLDAYVQQAGDFLVAVTFGQAGKNLLLAVGQAGRSGAWRKLME